MSLVIIKDYSDVIGHHHIKTEEGIIFLNSLITNHPVSVINYLEDSYDALISMVLEGEKKYHEIINEDPNDIDGARDALYGIFKNDSELDQEIENLENQIWLKNERKGEPFEVEEYLTNHEMETLSDDKQSELYDIRYNETLRKQEVEIVDLQGLLDGKIKFKESLSPIRLNFIPRSSELLEAISTDDLIFF